MLEYTPLADTPRPDTLRGQTPHGQTPPHPPLDGYCCGRYASYWNAFLLRMQLVKKGIRHCLVGGSLRVTLGLALGLSVFVYIFLEFLLASNRA